MKMIKKSLTTAIVILLSIPYLSADEVDIIKEKISGLIPPNLSINSIAESPMPNVYYVDMGQQSVFVHLNGDHLLLGEVYDTKRKVSLLKEQKNSKIAKGIKSLKKSSFITMGPKDAKHHITVFTDIDCGYCRKLHFETVPKLIEAGVQIRYLLWPRSGVNSESYTKAVSAYCADDQVQALTDAKAGKIIETKTCENSIAQEYQLGIELGVRGTPNIILDNGTVIPGYVPAEQIIAGLN